MLVKDYLSIKYRNMGDDTQFVKTFLPILQVPNLGKVLLKICALIDAESLRCKHKNVFTFLSQTLLAKSQPSSLRIVPTILPTIGKLLHNFVR